MTRVTIASVSYVIVLSAVCSSSRRWLGVFSWKLILRFINIIVIIARIWHKPSSSGVLLLLLQRSMFDVRLRFHGEEFNWIAFS